MTIRRSRAETTPLRRRFPLFEEETESYRRGVFPFQQIKRLIENGNVVGAEPIDEAQIQPASLDLRLGAKGYQVRASFMPGGRSITSLIEDLTIQEIDIERPFVLQKDAVYIFPLLESLKLPRGLICKANPKSTTGRLDIFVRLMTESATRFDRVEADYHGPLYLEVTPKSFNVQVHKGTSLSQLRFMAKTTSQVTRSLSDTFRDQTLLFDSEGKPRRTPRFDNVWLSVDLAPRGESDFIGWRARPYAPVIDLDKIAYYEPMDFWEPVRGNRGGQLILETGAFYILSSKERVRIPPGLAAEMVPYDPAMGEFRVHYAGFFDPGFGDNQQGTGTKVVLEVRSHHVPYLLMDGQRIGWLVYERLMEEPQKVYGGANTGSSYQHQDVGLSKQFKTLDRIV